MTPPERSCSQGEPFTPLGRCSIATAFGVYVLDPAVSGGGQYTFVPGPFDPAGAQSTLAEDSSPTTDGPTTDSPTTDSLLSEDAVAEPGERRLGRPHWMPFMWVRWVADDPGSGFRIHIGIGGPSETSVEVTGPVRRINGEFTTEVTSPQRGTRAGARLGRLLRFTLP